MWSSRRALWTGGLLLAALAGPMARPARAGSDPARDPQRITLVVVAAGEVSLDAAWVELNRQGATRTVRLYDDGSAEGDLPSDGVWVGTDEGPYARLVEARVIVARSGGEPQTLIAEPVRTDAAWSAVVGWRVELSPDGLEAHRMAVSHPGASMAVADLLPLAGSFWWLLFLMVYVFGLLLVRHEEPS